MRNLRLGAIARIERSCEDNNVNILPDTDVLFLMRYQGFAEGMLRARVIPQHSPVENLEIDGACLLPVCPSRVISFASPNAPLAVVA